MFALAAAAVSPVAGEEPPGGARRPTLDFAFEEIVELAADVPVGPTALGVRNIVPIVGGTFAGPRIKGTILPGGWDWQLRRADGCLEIKADYMLRADDGAVINVVNRGVACPPKPGQASPGVRTMAVFEPPMGRHQWLGQSAFVGTLEPWRTPRGPSVRIRFYQVQ